MQIIIILSLRMYKTNFRSRCFQFSSVLRKDKFRQKVYQLFLFRSKNKFVKT